MHPVGIIAGLIFTAFVVGAFSIGVFKVSKEPGRLKWLVILGLLLTTLGLVGLSVTGLAVSGGLRWLPTSFQWPVGSARGILIMPNNEVGVPLESIGRIQVYDTNGQFLRGVWVDFGKGNLELKQVGSNMVEIYDMDGHPHAQGFNKPKGWDDLPIQNVSISIPTPWWLRAFENPAYSWIYSWLVMTAGMCVLTMARLFQKLSGKKTELKKPQPRDI